MATELKLGDRVVRTGYIDTTLGAANPYHRCVGTIVEVYHSHPNHVGRDDTMYAVTWDLGEGHVDRGYLRIGLELQHVVLGGCLL